MIVRVDDVAFPIRTAWGLSVRKLRIQITKGGVEPEVPELHSALGGLLLSRWDRAVWRAMASSVDLFSLYANCRGSSESGREEVMNDLTNRSKHFMTMEVSATGR